MKTFYLHDYDIFSKRNEMRHNGFTAKINQLIEKPNYVGVQIAICSNKDNYCRKTGREVCATKPVVEMHLKDLAVFLQKVSNEVYFNYPTAPSKYYSRFHWVVAKLLD